MIVRILVAQFCVKKPEKHARTLEAQFHLNYDLEATNGFSEVWTPFPPYYSQSPSKVVSKVSESFDKGEGCSLNFFFLNGIFVFCIGSP